MNSSQPSHTFFLIFILIAVFAFLSLPFVFRLFADTTDHYLVAELNRAQAEMYFYQADHGNFEHACISGLFGFDQYLILDQTGHAVSCTISSDLTSMSMYTVLEDKDFVYCVDAQGVSKRMREKHLRSGYCSK